MKISFEAGLKYIVLTLSLLRFVAVYIFHLVVPRDCDVWPDIDCTIKQTEKVNNSRKLRSKGQPVTPVEEYAFHSDFSTLTDGNHWIIRTDSSFVNYSVAAGMFGAFALLILAVFFSLEQIRFNTSSFSCQFL